MSNFWDKVKAGGIGLITGGPIGALAGIAGSYAQYKAAKKQQQTAEQAAQQAREAAQPMLEAQRTSLPLIQDFVTRTLKTAVGSEDPLLKKSHESNLNTIAADTNKAARENETLWNERGDGSRGVGDRLRIFESGLKAKADETTDYGLKQKALQTDAENRYLGGLTTLAGLGSGGIGTALRGSEYDMLAADIDKGRADTLAGDVGSLAELLFAKDYQNELTEQLAALGIGGSSNDGAGSVYRRISNAGGSFTPPPGYVWDPSVEAYVPRAKSAYM